MIGHRGTNRAPKLPAELREYFRKTSKQVWAEIAYDLCVQYIGENAPNGAVLEELRRRHDLLRNQGLSA